MKPKLIAVATGLALSGSVLADGGSISQYGNDNFAYVDQTASGAYAYVYQSGDRNRVGSTYTYDYTTYNYPGVYQNNVSSGYSYLNQWGNDNYANLYQVNGSNMNAYINQGGYFYDDYLQQYSYGSVNSSSAYVSQYEGSDLNAQIYQIGGPYNYASISQGYGSSNNALIAQIGSSHSAGIGQSGSGNTARIVQR